MRNDTAESGSSNSTVWATPYRDRFTDVLYLQLSGTYKRLPIAMTLARHIFTAGDSK